MTSALDAVDMPLGSLKSDAMPLTEHLPLRRPALLGAVALGVLADLLIRVSGRPGLNVALWATVGVLVTAALLRRRSARVTAEAWWLVAGALTFACALVFRDAEALAVFGLFSAVLLLMLAAGRAATVRVVDAQVSDVAFALVRVALLALAGPIGWGRGAAETADPGGAHSRATRGYAHTALRTAFRGALLAVPALFMFSALLMNADPMFERVIQRVFLVDLEPLAEHVAFAAVIAWITAGYARALLVSDASTMSRLRVPRIALASAEVSVALWILNGLFLAFMVVQLQYLFGGTNLIEVTPGLSYAEYAKRGCFELGVCAALVVPLLLVADWAATPHTRRSTVVLRATMLVLVVLLFGVIASAAFRMRMYQHAYGLTESRLCGSAAIAWLTALLGWFTFTVLRGQRERFAFGGALAAVATVAALHLLNPHALIARVNIARALAGDSYSGATYDGAYLTSLSADAVPILLVQFDQLPPAERCRVARRLVKRWSGDRPGGWRTWNVSDARARRMVANASDILARASACPELTPINPAPETGAPVR